MRFDYCLVGVRRAQLLADAVCQLEAGDEGIQHFRVAESFLGVDVSEQEFLLSGAQRVMQGVVCAFDLLLQFLSPL